MSAGIFAHWPNRITALRFLGALVLFVIFALWGADGSRLLVMQISFWLFILVASTDFVDGYLARRDNLITSFGRVADPFVDKVLVLGAMIFLAVLEWSRPWFPAWIVVAVLSRELLVTGMRGYVESLGKPFPADWFGKIKMTLQCIAIGVVLGIHAFPWPGWADTFLGWAGHGFVWATLITSVGSGISYVLRTRRILLEGVA